MFTRSARVSEYAAWAYWAHSAAPECIVSDLGAAMLSSLTVLQSELSADNGLIIHLVGSIQSTLTVHQG